VKRIAIALFVLNFVASPALADGIKGVVGTIGMGVLSTMFCVLTDVYLLEDEEEEDTSGEDFDRTGFFVGVGGAYAGENFGVRPVNDIADIFSNRQVDGDFFYPGPEAVGRSDDTWSVSGRGGYRCHPRYSIGATLEYFGGFDTDWSGATGMGSDDIDMFVGTVDIKGYLATGRIQPFLLLGGGTMTVQTKVTNPTAVQKSTEVTPPTDPTTFLPNRGPVIQSRSYQDFVFRFGGGIDVYATENVVVNVGATYLLPMGLVKTLDLFTIGGGIEYRF
jgi:opacity protein-like surface antigen